MELIDPKNLNLIHGNINELCIVSVFIADFRIFGKGIADEGADACPLLSFMVLQGSAELCSPQVYLTLIFRLPKVAFWRPLNKVPYGTVKNPEVAL